MGALIRWTKVVAGPTGAYGEADDRVMVGFVLHETGNGTGPGG